MRDGFICGVRSEAIHNKLLTEPDLTIKKAQDIAQSIESADLNAKDIKGDASPQSETINASSPPAVQEREKEGTCYRCSRNHNPKTCKLKEPVCHRRHKRGYMVPACRSRSPPPIDKRKGRSNRKPASKKWMTVAEEYEEPSPCLFLREKLLNPPIPVRMYLNVLRLI